MLFSSTIFLFYFLPIVILIYYALGFSNKLRNLWLLVSSIAFYSISEPYYILGFLGLVVVNMILGFMIKRSDSKRTIMYLALFCNIGIVFIFKYWNFFGNTLYDIFSKKLLPEFSFIVPLGISFFLLRALSYILDVYHEKIEPSKSIVELGLYFSFFPTLIAGPFMNFKSFKAELDFREHNKRRFSVGLCRFIVGLSKKVLLADTFAEIAGRIFDLSTIGPDIYQIPVTLAWLGAFTFVLQIYFDFSAYCDMASGIGLMFGFKLPENFNYPIFSNTVSEFWSKFNITLFKWFDTYVMSALRSRHNKNNDSIIRNTFVLWIIIGLWHGSNWTFLIWGVFNFIFIVFENFINLKNLPIPAALLKLYTLIAITFGFVLFRSKDMYQAGVFIGNMFAKNYNGFLSDIALMYLREFWLFYIFGILFALPIARKVNTALINKQDGQLNKVINFSYPIVMSVLFVITLSYIVVIGQTEFIFYR